MTIIAKIFLSSNNYELMPFLGEVNALNPWVGFLTSVLTSSPPDGSPLIQNTNVSKQVDKLDGEEWWKLKAACAKTALKLF
jgi:hypothetical protein